MPKEILINADDFGISNGVNRAIIEGNKNGIINSASVMINLLQNSKEIEEFINTSNIKFGLHLNLTNGHCVSNPSEVNLLVNENGEFKNGFLKLLLLSLFKRKQLKKQIEIETKSQISKTNEFKINLQHIDSHRHIHMIPVIFNVVKKIAHENSIPRIRVINENIFYTTKYNRDFSYLFDGGLIKYLILRTFAFINNYKTNSYFFSILYTGKIFSKIVKNLKVPSNFTILEVGVHPNVGGLDELKDVCDENIISINRIEEFKMCMDLNNLKAMNENNN